MPNDSQSNWMFRFVIPDLRVHHARLEDIQQFALTKANQLRRGGIREGAGRTEAEMQQLLDKIPPSQRAGIDGKTAADAVWEYLADKDASHLEPYNKGGSSHPDNIKWEHRSLNRARGDRSMTSQEQISLDLQAQIDNLAGAFVAGVEAIPEGAMNGAITTVPFSLVKNGLRVVRGEMSAQEAALDTAQEIAIGASVGAVSAFTLTAIATACPPIAVGLASISPALKTAGGIVMIYEFFKILEDHEAQVRSYYSSKPPQQRRYLKEIEDKLIYEYQKTMLFPALRRSRSNEDMLCWLD